MPDKMISPVPNDAPALPTQRSIKSGDEWIKYDITHYWCYKSTIGAVLGYVVRYETPEGKETPPLTLWETDKGLKWRFKGFHEPRPLYNLDKIAHHPEATIVLVEGEKCAELAQVAADEHGTKKIIFSTWIGGGNSVYKADWAPLAGRKVYLWPDADEPGKTAMYKIGGLLRTSGCEIKLLAIPAGTPEGWDVADGILNDGWKMPEIYNFIKQHAGDLPDELPAPPEHEPTPEYLEPDGQVADTSFIPPFKMLGFSDRKLYFLLSKTEEIVSIPETKITHKDELINLTNGAAYWEQLFPGRSGADYTAAGSMVLAQSREKPMYDPTKSRGRGAWWDQNSLVINLGDRLLVDNKETKIFDFESKYTYKRLPHIEIKSVEPLTNVEAIKYRDLNEDLPWERPIYGLFQAGWAVTAHICGAWSWRPSIWVTAPAGVGKSWNQNEIVAPIVEPFCLSIVGNSSEAGIRSRLGCDSMAVLYDESEGETNKGIQRIQSILELIRQSASEGRGHIVKGTASGGSIFYDIRSMFMLSSIGVSLAQAADKSRVTVLGMRKRQEGGREHFEKLQSDTAALLTPEYCERMRERVRRLAPVIKQNFEVFRKVIAEKTSNQRTGDQVGMLLAGCYSCSSSSVIDIEFARRWITEQDWGEEEFRPETDEGECLRRILEFRMMLSGGRCYNIAELLIYAKPRFDSANAPIDQEEAGFNLRRAGIALQNVGNETAVCFASKHSVLGKTILKDSPWELNYSLLLGRLPGAEKNVCVKFSGTVYKSIRIPYGAVICEE